MKRIFIGHRGVGKSSLLERHEDYFPEVPVFDLDRYISEKENQPISDIFSKRDEAGFRELEKQYFQELIAHKAYVISVGAGFNSQLLPADAEVIYVSRRTDTDGRIFINRPRLNPELTPLQEYSLRYQAREPKFREVASWVYHLPEGLSESEPIEKKIFKKDFEVENAYLTLAHESEIKTWPNLIKFELRTDVFKIADIQRMVEEHSDKKFIVSVRSKSTAQELRGLKVDWALELGPVPSDVNVQIISIHDGDFVEALKLMHEQPKDKHLKFCPVVKSFDELVLGLHWQQDDPQNRSFLPRTAPGQKSRWRWFRNLLWFRQKINFIQGLKDFDDQPSLYEYLISQKNYKRFGAVLGHPIHHSRTPMLQGFNMRDYAMILAIPLNVDEFVQAMAVLQEMGLQFAAVTSPLKLKAAELIGLNGTEMGVNSLIYHDHQWFGSSTDADGFTALVEESGIKDIKNLKVAIWGGGGVIGALKDVLPQAVEYSARTGNPRDENVDSSFSPDVVIWAAPRLEGVQLPLASWNPKYIVDINYVENSMGLEYAQIKPGAKYISGIDMFYAQAKEQFKFWAKYLMAEG